MIADIRLLFALRWTIGWNNFRSRKVPAKVLTVIGFVFLAATAGTLSSVAGIVAGVLLRAFPGQHLDTIIPGAILTAASMLILFSSFGVALGSLFLSGDLELLMSAPVDRRAVFITKILDGMGFYYATVAFTALPALITYGLGIGYGPLYYLLIVVALIGTPLFPASLASLLVILVARFAPARRVREVLGLMGALFGITCGVLGQTARFWMRDLSGSSTNGTVDGLLAALRGLAAAPLPSMVAGRGLSAAGRGDIAGAFVGLSGFLLLTFGLFGGCVLVADSLYTTGWMRMQSSGSAKRTKQRAAQAASRGGLLSRAPAFAAIMLKDWRIIPRDLRNFAQMLSPLLFLPVVYINILGGRDTSRSLSRVFARGGVDPTGVLIAGGVLLSSALVFGRIADTGISREGKAWWLLKAAPISAIEIMRAKFLTALVPFMVLSSLLMIGAAFWKGFSLFGFLYGWFGVELLGAGLLAVQAGLAVPWARLDWDDPRRMSSGWGAIITLVAWAFLVLLAGGALCLPLLAEIARPALVVWGVVGGLVLSSLIVVLASALALQFGVSRLGDVGEA